MDRQKANKEIVDAISRFVENNPDLRFHQILHIMNVEQQAEPGETTRDLFNEESTQTLKRMKASGYFY
jgi:MinD-like ATPase involved in chromosome partitioning or flagellar assembly